MGDWKIFVNGIMAGVFIGIAGTVYLAVPIPIVGAFLFGFGLLTILCNNFKLFTGAVGYLASQGRNTPAYLWTLALIWGGNLLGCFAVGTAMRYSRVAVLSGIVAKAQTICAAKTADSWSSLLILAFFCGILMYLAVDTFKRELPPVIRLINVFLCVMVFILSGFEHCIANMYYFSVAGIWSVNNLGLILLMTLGNALGGMFPVVADKLRN
ncbi:MAG: formate/nitrite transporter family protein [Lentisphaerae bacterium]|nr:formate/nitrite transporter family protein [Lentisphaerota bacterium]